MDWLSRWPLTMCNFEHREKICIINVMYSETECFFFLTRSPVRIIATLESDAQITKNSEDREM